MFLFFDGIPITNFSVDPISCFQSIENWVCRLYGSSARRSCTRLLCFHFHSFVIPGYLQIVDQFIWGYFSILFLFEIELCDWWHHFVPSIVTLVCGRFQPYVSVIVLSFYPARRVANFERINRSMCVRWCAMRYSTENITRLKYVE